MSIDPRNKITYTTTPNLKRSTIKAITGTDDRVAEERKDGSLLQKENTASMAEQVPSDKLKESLYEEPPAKRKKLATSTGPISRQSYSCAECRRLKLKCNRVWPCSSCIRRGVEQICPNGEMMSGRGRRLILASHSELHSRIADLEKALALAHAKTDANPHELLTNTYLYSPRDSEVRTPARSSTTHMTMGDSSGDEDEMTNRRDVEPKRSEESNSLRQRVVAYDPSGSSTSQKRGDRLARLGQLDQRDLAPTRPLSEDRDLVGVSLGSLTIAQNGEARFVGSSGGSSFLHADGPNDELAYSHPHLPTGITSQVSQFASSSSNGSFLRQLPCPLGGGSAGDSISLVDLWHRVPTWEPDHMQDRQNRSTLYGDEGDSYPRQDWRQSPQPLADDGMSMVKAYWENVDWMYNVVPRVIFDSDYLPSVYHSSEPPSPHKLAVVYLVMALGVMFHLERHEPYDPLGDLLFRMGFACLTVNDGLSRASIATVQALCLVGNYMLNDRSPNGANAFWPILGIANNTVTALGLHRDGTAFNGLSPYEIEERRKVFWEITTLDRLQAMCFARPSALSNRSFDTKFPGSADTTPEHCLPDEDSYHRSKYQLVHLMELVIDEQTRTTAGSYNQVLKIDAEIMQFRADLPATMVPTAKASALSKEIDLHPHMVLHRYSIRLLVMETRIYLHRAYFVRALHENPTDPSKSSGRFHKSFISIFESAVELVSIVHEMVVYHPSLVARWWFYWFHAFSAAVCLAAICIRSPNSGFASPAYMSLVTACNLAQAAVPGSKAKCGLPILQRLRQKASNAMLAKSKVAHLQNSLVADSHSSIPLVDEDLSHIAEEPKVRRVKVATTPVMTTPSLTNHASSLGSGIESLPGSLNGFSVHFQPTAQSEANSLSMLDVTSLPEHIRHDDNNLSIVDLQASVPIYESGGLYHLEARPQPWLQNRENDSGLNFGSPISPVTALTGLSMDNIPVVPLLQEQDEAPYMSNAFTHHDQARRSSWTGRAMTDGGNLSMMVPFDQLDAYGIYMGATDMSGLEGDINTTLTNETSLGMQLLPAGGSLADVEQFIAGLHRDSV